MNAEQNLKQRLAAIVKVAQMDPFAKLASTDTQLDLVAEAVLERKPAGSQIPNQPVKEQVQKTATIYDMNITDIVKDENFRKGFASVMEKRAAELEEALAKAAAMKFTPSGVAAGVGGAAGAVGGYRQARAKGRGRVASAMSGAIGGVGGAVIGEAAVKAAPKALAAAKKMMPGKK